MKKPAIFLDIDGCILSEDGNVNKDYFDALLRISQWARKAFVGNFPDIRFVSGRDRNSVGIVANLLGIVNCWHVIEGGAYLYNPTTWEVRRHPAITPKIQAAFSKIRVKRVPQILKLCPTLELYPGELTCITFVRKKGTNLTIENICKIVRGKFSGLIRKRLVKISHSQVAINIVPPRVSKGAVRWLAEIDNIDLSKSLAIGDSAADIPLLRQTGLTGCPNNASKECKDAVKERKGRVSRFNYAAGVADIIGFFSRI